jgi:hydroxyethylthiazole kinase-like uncharacterized protein yjeF
MVIGLPETQEGNVASGAGRLITKQASDANAVLIGPGMVGVEDTAHLVAELLEAASEQTAFVFDAGALPGLLDCPEQLHKLGRGAVITPHAGEMAQLLDVSREAITADPLRHAQLAASMLRCTVVLKGGTTHVVEPDGDAWVVDGGTIGLATSGSGDVLAGIIAGLLARGARAVQAAIWGVYMHAQAGRRLTQRYGGIGLLARELPGEIPVVMADTQLLPPPEC